jgi:HlyD family secretion protein
MNQMTAPSRAEIEEALDLSTARKGRRWLKRLLWLALLAAMLAGATYAYNRYAASSAKITYDTLPATTADLTVTVSATGTIQPITQVDIGSEMSGVIRAVNVDDNDLVKAGDVLALLDTERLEAQKLRARAQIAAAEARLAQTRTSQEESKAQEERQTSLRKRGLSTEQSFDSAKYAALRGEAAIAAAEADLAGIKADLAIIETDLKRSIITSPIDGIVLKRTAEPGQTVAASFQAPVLFTIAQDLTRVQLEAAVDEADMGAVKAGQKATFTVDAYRGRDFPAAIERLSYAPETVDGVVTYKAILSAPNEDLALRPGMTATARIIVEQYEKALTVANEALRYQPPRVAESSGFSITQLFMPRFPRSERGKNAASADGSRDIYVLRNGAPVKLAIKTGASDGRRTLVREGELKDGDEVISAQRQSTGATR